MILCLSGVLILQGAHIKTSKSPLIFLFPSFLSSFLLFVFLPFLPSFSLHLFSYFQSPFLNIFQIYPLILLSTATSLFHKQNPAQYLKWYPCLQFCSPSFFHHLPYYNYIQLSKHSNLIIWLPFNVFPLFLRLKKFHKTIYKAPIVMLLLSSPGLLPATCSLSSMFSHRELFHFSNMTHFLSLPCLCTRQLFVRHTPPHFSSY